MTEHIMVWHWLIVDDPYVGYNWLTSSIVRQAMYRSFEQMLLSHQVGLARSVNSRLGKMTGPFSVDSRTTWAVWSHNRADADNGISLQ